MSRKLWELQHNFNKKFWVTKGGWPNTIDAKTAATKDYIVHLIREILEVLDELSWKMHRASSKQELDLSNILEELIDTQKFLYGIAQLWGFSHEEYEIEFLRKSSVVEQRFAQEQQLSVLQHQPVVLIDIDGVLTDYPSCFYKWLDEEHLQGKLPMTALQYYRALPLKDREALKRLYRQSGVKQRLPLMPGARELLQLLRQRTQFKLVLLTNRPYAEHYRIYPDTLAWLQANSLPFDAIFWARDKGLEAVQHFSNIHWALDDSPENAKRLREASITVVQLDPQDTRRDTQAFYTFVLELMRDNKPIEHAGFLWNKKQSTGELK